MRAHFSGMRYGDLKKQVAEMTDFAAGAVPAALSRDHGRSGLPGRRSAGRRGAGRSIANSTVDLVKGRMGLYSETAP